MFFSRELIFVEIKKNVFRLFEFKMYACFWWCALINVGVCVYGFILFMVIVGSWVVIFDKFRIVQISRCRQSYVWCWCWCVSLCFWVVCMCVYEIYMILCMILWCLCACIGVLWDGEFVFFLYKENNTVNQLTMNKIYGYIWMCWKSWKNYLFRSLVVCRKRSASEHKNQHVIFIVFFWRYSVKLSKKKIDTFFLVHEIKVFFFFSNKSSY